MKSIDVTSYHGQLADIAKTKGWSVHEMAPHSARPRLWLQRCQCQDPSRRLYISAGIHGDEPAGPLAVLRLIEEDEALRDLEVFLFPLLNPAGFEKGCRENADGIDLNRDYLEPKSLECSEHVAILKTLPSFGANICLHEDWETSGFYFYELNLSQGPSHTSEIYQAMSAVLPAETAPLIDGFEAVAGVISRGLGPEIFDRIDWPESLYLATYHTQLGYTFETPSTAALDLRIATLAAGVTALCQKLKQS